jgi:hypothetical protein
MSSLITSGLPIFGFAGRQNLWEERNPQDAGWRVTVLKWEGANRREHLFVVAEDTAQVLALLVRQTGSVLADDVGEFGVDLLCLFGRKVDAFVPLLLRIMGCC